VMWVSLDHLSVKKTSKRIYGREGYH